jgi:hypothetical protein
LETANLFSKLDIINAFAASQFLDVLERYGVSHAGSSRLPGFGPGYGSRHGGEEVRRPLAADVNPVS